MNAPRHSTPVVSPAATENGETVSLSGDDNPRRLQLTRARPGEALCAVMTRRWAAAGKSLDGGPGRPWEVSWDGPLGVVRVGTHVTAWHREA